MTWIVFAVKAEIDLAKLPENIAKRIILKIEAIAEGDLYDQLDKMTNLPYYKFRVGIYGEIVNIVNDKMMQLVQEQHRSQVYCNE